MPSSMEAHLELAEAPALTIDPADVLSRLEQHVAEAGRLHGRLDVVEETLERERTARRKLLQTLKSERRVAEALKSRAERAESRAPGDARSTCCGPGHVAEEDPWPRFEP